MKKTFSRWIQTLTAATTSETSTKKRQSKRGKKSSAPQSKKLALEHLEDRCLLTASSITFNSPQDFTYQPSETSSLSFGLERTSFLEVAKISNRGNDIVSIDRELHTVSVFLNQGNSNYSLPVKTEISGPGFGSLATKYALADMNGDNISDLLVIYPKQVTQGGATRTDLFVDVYSGISNGKFSTTPVTTQIVNPFGLSGTDNDLTIGNVQVRNVTGSTHPDLLITLTGTSFVGSNKTETTKSFFYVGENNKFVTTTVAIPSSVTGDAIGFANLTSNASSWQLVSQTETASSDSKNIQTLYFSNTTITSSAVTVTAAGKKEYPAATTYWTKIANVDQRAGDEIITGIHYINNNNHPTYAVRVSSITAGLPSGNTEAPVSFSTINVEVEPRYCTIGDMNGDGYADILISDGTSYQFLIGSATGFTAQSKVDSFANYLAVQAWDFNGDGYQDIVAIGEKHAMFIPGGPSGLDYSKAKIIETFTAKVTNAVFGDFNGDGYLDFVVTQGDAGTTLTLYVGKAPGGDKLFDKFTTISEARSPSVLITGNFITQKVVGAQYPKTDLAVLHGDDTKVLVVSFDGAKVITRDTNLPSRVVHIAAGDFNNDRYDDIIAVNENNATVTILANKGGSVPGTFDLGTPISVGTPLDVQTSQGSRSCFVATADINGDGRLDFAVLNAGDNEVRFYTQNTNGTFSLNTATARIDNLNLKPGVRPDRNYQMIFEDFDLDGRMDLLIGVTGTNQAMIFQNKGTQAGQFSSDRNWVGTNLILEGSLNNKTVFAISTGFKTGNKNAAAYASKTPGVVLVSGNKIYSFENTTPSEMSPGLMEIVFREYRGATLPLNNGQYNTIPAGTAGSAATNDPRLTWLHEWGHYYLEVWGSSGSTEDISTFACTINYNKSLFSVISTDIEATSNFTLNSKTVNAGTGQIIVSGTAKSAGFGANQYVLLFRVYVSPAVNTGQGTIENVGLRIPNTGYATPVSSGFLFDSGTPQINSKNLVNLTDGRMMPVYPVIYDLNDDGVINASDFSAFANPVQSWGKTVEGPNSVIAKWDFNHNGTVDVQDFTNFARTWLKKRGDIFLHSLFPGNFPTAWPQLTVSSSAAMMAMSAPLEVAEELLGQEEPAILFAGSLIPFENDSSCTTADIITAESDQIDIKSPGFSFSAAVPSFELTTMASLSVSELDTLGYVARTESIYNSDKQKRIETLDQVLADLFQEEEDALTLEEITRITEQPFDSLRLNDQVLAELV